MTADQELSVLISKKSVADLKNMLLNSSEWSDEALKFAKAELENRGDTSTEISQEFDNQQSSNRTQYKIFGNSSGEFQAVKIGWCWPAFLYSWLWAMVGNMWDIGVGVFLLDCLFYYFIDSDLKESPVYGIVGLIYLLLRILFGVKGNVWRESNLRERGFELKGTVQTKNKDRAVAMFLKNQAGVAS